MFIRTSLVFLLAISFNVLTAQSTQTITYDFNNFDELQIGGDFVVYYTPTTGEESMELEVSNHLVDKLRVYEENSVLHINHKLINNWSRRNVLTMHISSPKTLEEIRVSGDAKLYLEAPLEQDRLSIAINSDGELQGTINIGTLNFKGNSDGVARLQGEVDNLTARLNSDAYIDGFRLNVKEVDINLNSDTKAELTITEELKAVLNSDARLVYRGQPTIIEQRVNGDARVRSLDR